MRNNEPLDILDRLGHNHLNLWDFALADKANSQATYRLASLDNQCQRVANRGRARDCRELHEGHRGVEKANCGVERGEMIYMGKIYFKDGENMDIETTIKRIAYSMLECWNWR